MDLSRITKRTSGVVKVIARNPSVHAQPTARNTNEGATPLRGGGGTRFPTGRRDSTPIGHQRPDADFASDNDGTTGYSSDKQLIGGGGARTKVNNPECTRSRERGQTIPKQLVIKESPLVRAACSSDNSAPYGRSRPGPSSRKVGPLDGLSSPGAINPDTGGQMGRGGAGNSVRPPGGAGRARGVNIWYPNIGIDASGDSGDSQDSDETET